MIRPWIDRGQAPLSRNTLQTAVPRFAAFVAAGLIAAFSIVTVQKAFAAATVANGVRAAYTIPAGGSVSFSVPTVNAPFQLMVTQLNNNFRGVASATLAYSLDAGNEMLSWTGMNSFQTNQTDATLASGWANTSGVKVLKVGFNGTSYVETLLDAQGNPSRFNLKNTSTSSKTIVLTMVW